MNRIDKRKISREATKWNEWIIALESSFVECLFNTDELADESYQSIFLFHNAEYLKLIKKAKSIHKFKTFDLDPNYFFNKYKPLENVQ